MDQTLADKTADSFSAESNTSQFFITVNGLPDDTFAVLEYQSSNYAISKDFKFCINTIGKEVIAPEELIGKKATLITKRGSNEQLVHGIITGMQYLRKLVDGYEHILILQSPISGLQHNSHNRVFLNKDIKMIVEEVLLGAGIAAADIKFKTRKQYLQNEFIVQYHETDLAFLQRMIAFHGIYFRFVFEPLQTIITFYDNNEDLPQISGNSTLEYIPQSGTLRHYETIYAMRQSSQLLTESSYLKDYNYRTPEAALESKQSNNTAVTGSGTDYSYGENFLTLDAGEQLSTITQQSIDWQRETYIIETDCRAVEPGQKLSISNHPDDKRNGDYLVVDVLEMLANQRDTQLVNFGGKASSDGNKSKSYFVKCRIIRIDVAYRSQLIKRPSIRGSFNAVVESTGGEYAYIDEQGRYRIRLDFDIGDAPVAQASHPVRMAQAYTGQNYGIHFPLHANTEVVVSCINGDINRPIILGTVPNPENHSPVTLNNNSHNILRTFGDNELLMDDTIGAEKIELFTKDKQNILSLDATKDAHKISLRTEQGKMEIKAAKTMKVDSEDSQLFTSGGEHSIFVENRQRLMTKNEEITQTAATDIVKHARQNVNCSSATENTEINVGNDMIVDVENNCSFEVKNKDMSFKIAGGKFEVEAAKAITLKGDGGGTISIKQSGAKIEMDSSGMINIQGSTVSIDASSIMLKGGMMTHVPGGGGGGGGAGASGGSGSASFSQSEIGKYEGFVFNSDGAEPEQQDKAVTTTAAETPADTPAEEGSVPEVFNPAWSTYRTPVGQSVYVQFNFLNFKGGEAVKVTITEYDANRDQKDINTLTTTVKEMGGMIRLPWEVKSTEYESETSDAPEDLPNKPIQYHFTIDVNGEKLFNPKPLILTTTFVIETEDDEGIKLPDGITLVLSCSEGKKHKSQTQNGVAKFKDVALGKYSIEMLA
ncbi:hypothetical protein MNBD_GAMMA22-2051 [hydrothermal vent metagenome]|uniref:Gp5/Type VI secretion system Vgr protein OB-fold domain-containing protein n=1 Tax=hydrothermal vent metagenome TaxID=652676 RepID=A0A3B1ACC0_9ZZZZ